MKNIFIILSTLLLIACGATQSSAPQISMGTGGLTSETSIIENENQVGSIANNPGNQPKKLILMPDFSNAFPEDALMSGPFAVQDWETQSDSNHNDSAKLWNELVATGSLANSRLYRDSMVTFEAALRTGTQVTTDSAVSIELNNVRLINKTGDWNVTIEQTKDSNQRMIVRDTQDKIWAYYIFDETVSNGIFAFVNQDNRFDAHNSLRAFSVAFDINNEHNNMIVRTEEYDNTVGGNIAYNMNYQCNIAKNTCRGLYSEVSGASHQLSDRTFKIKWQNDKLFTCLNGGLLTVSRPSIRENKVGDSLREKLEAGYCLIKNEENLPAYSAEDILMRLEDTFPTGGTALEWSIDEKSLPSWETSFSLEIASNWIDGIF